MKKLFIAVLVLATTVVSAAEINVLETEIRSADSFNTHVSTRFYMDQTTLEGFAKVTVTEERIVYDGPYQGCNYDRYGRCYPAPMPMPRTYSMKVYENTVKIDGLMLMDDKVIFHGAEGDVDCGTMGLSRVFKKPTLYLSGNCELKSRLVNTRLGSMLTVTLKTK